MWYVGPKAFVGLMDRMGWRKMNKITRESDIRGDELYHYVHETNIVERVAMERS